MLLVIPSQCKIGCRTIKIVFSDKVLDWKEKRAHENIKEEIIRLHTGESDAATFEALIHEALHIVHYLYGREDDEQGACIEAEAMCQFLMSLGIEPDFSQVPEEKL